MTPATSPEASPVTSVRQTASFQLNDVSHHALQELQLISDQQLDSAQLLNTTNATNPKVFQSPIRKENIKMSTLETNWSLLQASLPNLSIKSSDFNSSCSFNISGLSFIADESAMNCSQHVDQSIKQNEFKSPAHPVTDDSAQTRRTTDHPKQQELNDNQSQQNQRITIMRKKQKLEIIEQMSQAQQPSSQPTDLNLLLQQVIHQPRTSYQPVLPVGQVIECVPRAARQLTKTFEDLQHHDQQQLSSSQTVKEHQYEHIIQQHEPSDQLSMPQTSEQHRGNQQLSLPQTVDKDQIECSVPQHGEQHQPSDQLSLPQTVDKDQIECSVPQHGEQHEPSQQLSLPQTSEQHRGNQQLLQQIVKQHQIECSFPHHGEPETLIHQLNEKQLLLPHIHEVQLKLVTQNLSMFHCAQDQTIQQH